MSFAVLAAEATESSFPTWVPPIIAAVFFIAAFLIVWSFRDVANRHRDKASASDAADHGSEAHH